MTTKANPKVKTNPSPSASKPAPVKPKPAPAKASAPADAADKIKLLVTENPHGTGTKDHGKFELVAANLTVGAALKAGVDRGYLNYAAKRKLLAIG